MKRQFKSSGARRVVFDESRGEGPARGFLKAAWLLPLALLLGGCVHQGAFDDAQREIVHQDEVIKQLKAHNEKLSVRTSALQTDLSVAQAEVAALKKGHVGLNEDVASMRRQLLAFKQRFGQLDKNLGVVLKPHAEGLALEVAATVLFAPGKASLRKSGKSLLMKLAQRLKEYPGLIRVEGHTDDRPVVLFAKQYPWGNLQLSGQRALVVARFLSSEGGLPAKQISYAGYGQYRPVAANDSPQHMSRNRRVEIVLLGAKKAR